MVAEPEWAESVIEPPEVAGVTSSSTDGITVRVTAKTLPRRQQPVATELRGRITDRLRRDGVKGPGRTVLVSATTYDPKPPSPTPDASLRGITPTP